MSQPNEKELSLLEENVRLSKAIFEQNKKIKRRLMFIAIGDYLRLAFIIIPIIVAAIFLPPLLKDWIGAYQELLSPLSSGKDSKKAAENIFSNVRPDQIKEILNLLQSR